MVKSFVKLLLLGAGFTILAGIVVVSMRYMGAQQAYVSPHHPWFERAFWWVYAPPFEDICAGKDLTANLPKQDWILTVPVKRHDEEWFVPCPAPIKIATFLKGSVQRDWLIQVKANDTWSLDQLVEAIAPFNVTKHFAISADSQKVAVYLRKKAPEWLFAADGASLLRLRLFESLWLETAIDFWPDFVTLTFNPHEPFHLDPRGAAELARRKKRVLWIWDPNTSLEPRVSIQGIMTNRPTAATDKFGARL